MSTKQLDYLVNNIELQMQVVAHGKSGNTNPSAQMDLQTGQYSPY